MITINLISLVALWLVFALWVAIMFQIFWRLTQRSLDRHKASGGGFTDWAAHNSAVFSEFSKSEEDRPARNRLFLATCVLFAIFIARSYLTPGLE